LLIRDVAAEFKGRVNVTTEEYGNSPTAKRFGVRRYPVVFVDDVLVARPKDFGFRGAEDVGAGRYAPFREPENQRRFQADLRGFIAKRLAGAKVEGFDPSEVATASAAAEGPASLPPGRLTDLDGREIDPASFKGRVVLVEMWATWCPPCRATLAWMNDFLRANANRVEVLAIAVDSKPEDVRAFAAAARPGYRIVIGTPDVLDAFGTVAAVPKLMVFDGDGRRAGVFYGAPPDLHQQIAQTVKRLTR
jgi:thiol-disulfide isomerase/thioredoxin